MRHHNHAQDLSGRQNQAYDPSLPQDPGRLDLTRASAVRILYSIIYDAPGAWTDAQGHIHHGGGGPGDPVWAKLSPAVRDDLTGRAILELAALTSNREVHAQIAKAASALLVKR
jgi:hypothetical protein